MSNRVDGVYVVHAPAGYEEHGSRVSALLSDLKMDFKFVNETALDDMGSAIERYFCPEIQTQLGKGALLCTLSHILCYKKVVEDGCRFAMILEDDPCFLGRFKEQLGRVMREAETLDPGFVISLENSTLEFPPYRMTRKDRFLYPAQRGRCAGAYIIDLEGAGNILSSLEKDKCDQVIDHWHNKLIERDVFKMYWAHPPLVEQGSLNGMMNAGISSRADGFRRRAAWIAQKLYKTHVLRLFK